MNWYGTTQFQWMSENQRQLEEAISLENKSLKGLESRLEDMGLLEGHDLRSILWRDKLKMKTIYQYIKLF